MSGGPSPAASPRAHRLACVPLAALLLLAAGCATMPGDSRSWQRIAFTATPAFTEAAVKRGVTATRSDCARVEDAVWVESPEHGDECLRYWKAGFPAGPAGRAIVYFHGDVWTGEGAAPSYLRLTGERVQKSADDWARKLGMPYIHFGRPGTHGSSGDHRQRRRRGESELVSLALDQLKSRLGITEWIVVGQSGGGHLTASLLATRDDIACAVPASSVSSPRARWMLHGWPRDSTGYDDSHEPLEALVRENKHPKLRIFVVGSPSDTNVPWSTQQLLTARAKDVGLPVLELAGEGSGPAGHGMSDSGRRVAGWCAHDLPDDEIRERARAGLKG